MYAYIYNPWKPVGLSFTFIPQLHCFPVPSHASVAHSHQAHMAGHRVFTAPFVETWGDRELSSEEVVKSKTKSRRALWSHHSSPLITSFIPVFVCCAPKAQLVGCLLFFFQIYERLVNISGFKTTPDFVGSFTFVTFESLRTLGWLPKFVIEKVLELIPRECHRSHDLRVSYISDVRCSLNFFQTSGFCLCMMVWTQKNESMTIPNASGPLFQMCIGLILNKSTGRPVK